MHRQLIFPRGRAKLGCAEEVPFDYVIPSAISRVKIGMLRLKSIVRVKIIFILTLTMPPNISFAL